MFSRSNILTLTSATYCTISVPVSAVSSRVILSPVESQLARYSSRNSVRSFTMNSESPVDLLRESAKELQTRLADGKLTSVQLVDLCLAQIDKYDQNGPRLRAMIALAPRDMLRTQAENLDTERKKGRVRGPLHGIPVVVKVSNYMDNKTIMLTNTRISMIWIHRSDCQPLQVRKHS